MTSSKQFGVVSLQLPTTKPYQKNLDALLSFIKQHKDKKLIVAPEVCLTGYDYERVSEAAIFSKEALRQLIGIVDEQIVVLTLLMEEAEGFVNMAVVIHQHKVVHRQRKAKLFKLGEEDRYLRSGSTNEVVIFEIEPFKYALLICFELRFKELWRQIEGADVVIIPARWGLPRKSHLEVLSRALAIMNQCYVVVANSADEDMAQSSALIAPDGDVIMDDKAEAIEGVIRGREITKARRYIVMD
jgi:predicted amidohydrolase